MGRSDAFPLNPDQSEIRPRCTQIEILTVEDERLQTASGQADRDRRPNQATSHNCNFPFGGICHFLFQTDGHGGAAGARRAVG